MIQSSGVTVIDWSSQEPTVLAVRAYANWDFPKGQVDEGESLLETAIRELWEETTLASPADVSIVQGVMAPAITYGKGKSAKTATYFVADRTSDKDPFLPVSPELGKPENDEWRWISVSQLSTIMPRRLSPVVDFLVDWTKRNK